MLTAEVTTCDVLRSKKREQKPIAPNLDFEIMRTSSLLSRVIEIVLKRTTENLKARLRIRRRRLGVAKSDSKV